MRLSGLKIGLGALLGAIGYAQELNIAPTSGPSAGEVKVRYAKVVLAISLDQPRGLDRPADIYPTENIATLKTGPLELTHDEFLLQLNNLNSLKYIVINRETGLPRVLIRVPTNSVSDELQHTCKPWAPAGTFQGNEATGHGGDRQEGVSLAATIAYDSWGSLGSDSGAKQSYAQWNCDDININSSKVRILFRTMRSEGVPGSCRIYLRNLDSGKWVYWGSITDGSDNLWAISLETATELQAHISRQGRCTLMAVANDGWTFDQVKFEYTCRPPDVPVLVSPYRGASGVAYAATYFDWPDIKGVRAYEIAISPGETYMVPSSFCFKTTAPNTSYTWKVRAANSCGWGAWSATKTFTTSDTRL